MGTRIKKNNKGQYNLVSTNSDKQLHTKKWISEADAKKIFIEKVLWKAMEDILCVEMDFPEGYTVNDKIQFGDRAGLSYIIKSLKKDNGTSIHKKFLEIIKKYNLEEYFIETNE